MSIVMMQISVQQQVTEEECELKNRAINVVLRKL